MERQFGLLENTLDKVTFSKTINYRGVNVQEIDCNCDIKLYVKIENNRIFIIKIGYREWNIICSEKFLNYFSQLDEKSQIKISIVINYLEEKGVNLGAENSSKIKGTNFNLRELRPINSNNEAIRIFYTFTPKRMPILLGGGNKDNCNPITWYKQQIKYSRKRIY
ncbi:type II toxin-antitoxin system RelE/ParE family toxin [Geminocystis sp.]|uniref:type II toxin-antitoxin system RelE/ParE family toxin n=1 Tax=Geminocystis sp. TaxID=2664100 RepID=UPI0035943926